MDGEGSRLAKGKGEGEGRLMEERQQGRDCCSLPFLPSDVGHTDLVVEIGLWNLICLPLDIDRTDLVVEE